MSARLRSFRIGAALTVAACVGVACFGTLTDEPFMSDGDGGTDAQLGSDGRSDAAVGRDTGGADAGLDVVSADADVVTDAEVDGEVDAEVECLTPSCFGRCSTVTSDCDATAQCGICSDGLTCSETNCVCTPPQCGTNECGQIANHCDGGVISCGVACDAGLACTEDGGRLVCAPGECQVDAAAICTLGRCGKNAVPCGDPIECGDCPAERAADAGYCVENVCTCPERPLQLLRYKNALGQYCYGLPGSGLCASGWTVEATVGFIYPTTSTIGNPIYLCVIQGGKRALSANCYQDFPNTQNQVALGRCAGNGATRCGSLRLEAFRTSLGELFYRRQFSGQSPPPNSAPAGTVCELWDSP